jgi:hypothetical protein
MKSYTVSKQWQHHDHHLITPASNKGDLIRWGRRPKLKVSFLRSPHRLLRPLTSSESWQIYDRQAESFNSRPHYQPHAIALSGFDAGTVPVTPRTMANAVLQKNVNNNCRAHTKQKMMVPKNITIGEERITIVRTEYLLGFYIDLIWDNLAFVGIRSSSLPKLSAWGAERCTAAHPTCKIPQHCVRLYLRVPKLLCWELLYAYRTSAPIRKLKGVVSGYRQLTRFLFHCDITTNIAQEHA